MRDVLTELDEAIRNRLPVAYAVLVETRGSTPQKPGATMLVFPDGSQAGTLGGGCVEAEVKRRALQLLDGGPAQIVTFQLDADYGWDDGLICGGRMKMLIDPIRPGDDLDYYQVLLRWAAEGRGSTEAVVIEPQGDDQPPDRWLLDEEGAVVAHRGTGTPPPDLAANVKHLAQRPRPYVAGGISYLPRLHRCRLVIIGGGHVGQKVAELAHETDFAVWVVDDRESYCNAARFPFAEQLLLGPIEVSLSKLNVDENTFCIVVTRGHNHDEEALFHLVTTPARFLGMIGSRRKIRLIYEDLLRDGISPEALRRVHAPLGLDIGSQTVPEIAISIVAELIAHRNLGEIPDPFRRQNLVDDGAKRRLEEKNAC